MQSLANIIKIEQEQKIISNTAQQLGFCNIKIFTLKGSEHKNLFLLASMDTNNPSATTNNSVLLEAKLIQLLKCSVEVVVDKELKKFPREDLLKRAAALTETQAIKKMFNTVSIDQVNFDDSNPQDYPTRQLIEDIELADKAISEYQGYQKYLQEKSQRASSEFFKLADEQKPQEMVTDKKEQPLKMDYDNQKKADDMVRDEMSLSLKVPANRFSK